MPNCLISGITGQDGAYLARFLLERGYRVFGLVRQASIPKVARLQALGVLQHVELLSGDLSDFESLLRVLSISQPDEIYNLGAQSSVASSWTEPLHTGQATGIGAHTILEATRSVNRHIRFYQASSSEMFGQVQCPRQTEETRFSPRSPYAAAKLYAHWMTINYREGFGMHASAGILFNHESPLRGLEFVTRKITDGVARIKLGLDKQLALGNLEAERDWGHAKDYVRAMWLMLQQGKPDDYVIATGETRTIREFCRCAFNVVGLDWSDYVITRSDLIRPIDPNPACGDSTKARSVLGWAPTVTFDEMVAEMVEADLRRHSTRPEAS